MKTLKLWEGSIPVIPTTTVWMLNDLSEFKGKQELFTKQSPQKLKALKEHALIESAVSSNRIEGVEIDQKRIGTVIFGKKRLQDRDEEEVRGYQRALSWIHSENRKIPLSHETILRLHCLSHPDTWDSGKFKEKDGEIIEKRPDGGISIRFKPLSARETPEAVRDICSLANSLMRNREIPALAVWAAFNLDFLCIHPFRDGNGRVSRLLLLLMLYHQGFEVGRYISLERIIEQNKERYYETLLQSSRSWHGTKHDPWPYVNYLLYALKEIYREFESRYENTVIPLGEKTETVVRAVCSFNGNFHISQLQKACPEVSIDMIRKVLKNMRDNGDAKCVGRGKLAQWKSLSGNR
jgi:Fic family protein